MAGADVMCPAIPTTSMSPPTTTVKELNFLKSNEMIRDIEYHEMIRE